MPPKHSTTKILLELTEYEYELLKSWLPLGYWEYFDGNDPDVTGFNNSQSHHLDQLVYKICQDRRSWRRYPIPKVKRREPLF